jgi:hypothetical protein
MLRTTAIALAFLLAACGPTSHAGDDGGDDGGGDDGGDDAPDADTSIPTFPDAAQCTKMDVLFVIDNSGSMAQEQANLAANFPTFIQVLNDSGLDYRVAITSTGRNYSYVMSTPFGDIPESQDGGDDGRFIHPPACAMPHPWIEKNDPNPAGLFSCAANLGTSGPSDEMPLGAMRDALEDRMADGTNAGFLRSDALLAVVMLTDENDCSYEQSVTLPFASSLCDSMMEPVGNYVSFMDALTGSRQRWATAVIAGTGPGACSSTLGDADEATRLMDFVNQTGTNAVASSICEGDLSVGLAAALEAFSSACAAFPPIE